MQMSKRDRKTDGASVKERYESKQKIKMSARYISTTEITNKQLM